MTSIVRNSGCVWIFLRRLCDAAKFIHEVGVTRSFDTLCSRWYGGWVFVSELLVPPLDQPFNCESYAQALQNAGLAASDAAALARYSSNHFKRFANDTLPIGLYLPGQRHSRGYASDELRRSLAADLIQTQARGPLESPLREVWLLLYVEACPMDHIWPLFSYCIHTVDEFGDEVQDAAPLDVAFKRAQEQVHLRFPRSGGPWQGFGCEILLRKTLARVDSLVSCGYSEGSEFVHVLLRQWRVTLSLAQEYVDHVISLPPELQQFLAQMDLKPGGYHNESYMSDRAASYVIQRWIHALYNAVTTNTVVNDVNSDRFVLPSEICSLVPPDRERRSSIEPPDPSLSARAIEVIANYRPDLPVEYWKARKLTEDPLLWLESARDLVREWVYEEEEGSSIN